MARITLEMIRKRAEHNEGQVATLEELALHQQHIEKIELLGTACRHLKILLLQNNLISKIERLHRLKELSYLNLALNNISKVQNLQRCESLAKLDLTANFIDAAGLLSLHALTANAHLADLHLLGNPCCDWPGYRPWLVATLPQLKSLDGQAVLPSEHITARQVYLRLEAELVGRLKAAGVDVAAARIVADDGADGAGEECEVEDPGYVDPSDGQFKRPWCPATRIIEHRESEALDRQQREERERARHGVGEARGLPAERSRRTDFPELPADGSVAQKNEGGWDFSLDEAADSAAIELEVAVSKYLDSSLIRADVQPHCVRLLIKGRLLQLRLPCAVKPDASLAQRSKASGSLLLHMPKAKTAEELDVAAIRPKQSGRACGRARMTAAACKENGRAEVKRKEEKNAAIRAIRPAALSEIEIADHDSLPPLEL